MFPELGDPALIEKPIVISDLKQKLNAAFPRSVSHDDRSRRCCPAAGTACMATTQRTGCSSCEGGTSRFFWTMAGEATSLAVLSFLRGLNRI